MKSATSYQKPRKETRKKGEVKITAGDIAVYADTMPGVTAEWEIDASTSTPGPILWKNHPGRLPGTPAVEKIARRGIGRDPTVETIVVEQGMKEKEHEAKAKTAMRN